MEETGPQPDQTSFVTNYLEESDIIQFGLMGDIEKEFSEAQSIYVCHDEERIYGLRLTIQMHRENYFDEDVIIKKHNLQDYFNHIDQFVQEAKPRRMTLIGSVNQNCTNNNIFQYGQVKTIQVFSDGTGIRGMIMKLTNANQYGFGKAFDPETMN